MKTMNLFRVLICAVVFAGSTQFAIAQQRKTTGKRSTTTVKRSTNVKKTTTTTAQPQVVTIDGTAMTDGHLAFFGIPVNQPQRTVENALIAKGFRKSKDSFGNVNITGMAYGVKCLVFVDEGRGVTVRETKAYTLAQAKKRVLAYQKAYVEATGGKVTQNSVEWNNVEGSNISVETTNGSIGISYNNQDEVNFESKYYDIIISIFEN